MELNLAKSRCGGQISYHCTDKPHYFLIYLNRSKKIYFNILLNMNLNDSVGETRSSPLKPFGILDLVIFFRVNFITFVVALIFGLFVGFLHYIMIDPRYALSVDLIIDSNVNNEEIYLDDYQIKQLLKQITVNCTEKSGKNIFDNSYIGREKGEKFNRLTVATGNPELIQSCFEMGVAQLLSQMNSALDERRGHQKLTILERIGKAERLIKKEAISLGEPLNPKDLMRLKFLLDGPANVLDENINLLKIARLDVSHYKARLPISIVKISKTYPQIGLLWIYISLVLAFIISLVKSMIGRIY